MKILVLGARDVHELLPYRECADVMREALVQLARGQALLNKRDYVIPDDIKQVAVPALAHRVTLRPELWVRQVSSDDVVAKLLSAVPTPKTDPSARAGRRDQAPAVTG